MPGSCPSRERAQGVPGDGLTHGPPATKKAGGSHHRFSRINRHSLRNGVRLITRSPRCPGFSSHRRLAKRPAKLDPSIGGSGPHAFAVRTGCVRQQRQCVHRIPLPTSVTIAKRPSYRERDAATYTQFLIFVKRNFSGSRAGRPDQIEPAHEFRCLTQRFSTAFWALRTTRHCKIDHPICPSRLGKNLRSSHQDRSNLANGESRHDGPPNRAESYRNAVQDGHESAL